MGLTLTRELRIGLEPPPATAGVPANASNGFAGNPALTTIAPFVLLRASLAGAIDASTGMLINIKIIDQVLRDVAVPFMRDAYYAPGANPHPGLLLPKLFRLVEGRFAPHRLTAMTLAPSPFLWFQIHDKEPQMIKMSQRFEFSAAHRLHADSLSEKKNQEIFGRCNNPNGHGHNYEVEVTLAGTPDPQSGNLLPGGILQLQQLVNQRIIDHFDHKHLNLDCVEFQSGLNPTVENIARVIYQKLKPAIPGPATLHCIKVWETPKTVAEYSE
jgi:6-pyruvoyltetrahydropterin/6-carboxytetrahydropterin synthase